MSRSQQVKCLFGYHKFDKRASLHRADALFPPTVFSICTICRKSGQLYYPNTLYDGAVKQPAVVIEECENEIIIAIGTTVLMLRREFDQYKVIRLKTKNMTLK